jgi:hypothetical protein
MTKDELREKVKALVKQVYKPASNDSIDTDNFIDSTDNTDDSDEMSVPSEKFPIVSKFPPLKEVIETLLTPNYGPFVKDIQWVAPKPLTFRVILANDELFYLIYTPKSWIAQIEGKKYYLLNIGEEEFACQTLAHMLYYGETAVETPPEESFEFPETPGEASSPGRPPTSSTPAEETPAEAPAVEKSEEVPAEA